MARHRAPGVIAFTFFAWASCSSLPRWRSSPAYGPAKVVSRVNSTPAVGEAVRIQSRTPAAAQVDQFYPQRIFPSTASFLPKGVTYVDVVPNTIDLSERAGRYIKGVVATADPNQNYSPTAAALSSNFSYSAPGPRFFTSYWGSPNWGEVLLALAEAREMTGYDRDNSAGTFNMQLAMMYGMFKDTENFIVTPGGGTTPMVYAMQSLLKTSEQNPSSELSSAIELFYRLIRGQLKPVNNSGKTYWGLFADLSPLTPDPTVGYMGPMYVPFIQGTTLIGLEEFGRSYGDPALPIFQASLRDLILEIQGSYLWTSPDANFYPFPAAKGFAGHMYSWLEATRGVLMNARKLRATQPAAAAGYAAFGRDIYDFVKQRTYAGWVGNFGSSGTTADMISIGLLLSELGAGDNYDEIDAWVRNQLTECEIDDHAAAFIPNYNSSDWSTNQVGNKVKGLFFADATHVSSIPSVSQAFTSDDHAMAFRGLYDVWTKIAKVDGVNAYVNFHMNVATPILDVKSEVPYRGRIEVYTKANLGGVRNLYLHIPAGVDRTRIRISKLNSNGTKTLVTNSMGVGPYSNYVMIGNIAPRTRYLMDYPLWIHDLSVFQVRGDDKGWYESSFPLDPSQQNVQSWTGKFRGGTMVALSTGPGEGIPRYSQPWRASLANLNGASIVAPFMNVNRFVHQGTSQSLGVPNPQPASDWTDTVTTTPVATSCKITQATCPSQYPNYRGVFDDNWNGSNSNAEACMKRAKDFHDWCGMKGGQTSTATYYYSGVAVSSAVSGTTCIISQATCPSQYPNYRGVFEDNYNGSASNADACMRRARDFYSWCGMSGTQSSMATFYLDGAVNRTVTVGGGPN